MGVFMCRELAGDDGARGLEAAHGLRVPIGNPTKTRLRSPGGQHAFGVVDVLERDGHPVQGPPAATGRDLGVRRPRRREGALVHERHVGAEAGVVGLDARERRLDELKRLELPRRDHPGRIGQREVRQIDHVSLSSGAPTVGVRPFCPRAFARGRRHDRTRKRERRPCLRLRRAGADPENQQWYAGVRVRAKRSNRSSTGLRWVTARPTLLTPPRRGGRGSPPGRPRAVPR